MPWKETTIMEQKIEFICEWRTGKHKRVHPNLDLSGFLGGGQGETTACPKNPRRNNPGAETGTCRRLRLFSAAPGVVCNYAGLETKFTSKIYS